MTRAMDRRTMHLYTDGASRGNPGEAGAGIVLYDPDGPDKGPVLEEKKYLGVCTNNEAEYRALILGLEEALKLKFLKLTIHLDSELVVRQMEGIYKIKNGNLSRFASEAKRLLAGLEEYRLTHVPRTKNREADRLANEAIDEYNKSKIY